MPSQAEVDLIVDASRTLPELERDLARIIAEAQAGADDLDLTAALDLARSLAGVNDDLDRLVRAATLNAPDIRLRTDVDEDQLARVQGLFRRLTPDLTNLTRVATSAGGALATMGASIGTAGAAAGGAIPVLAGVAAAAQQILPAAAVATQGMLAMQLVSGTLKLGLMGVEDALSAAFDPDVKPEELAKSMAKLAPEARTFVTALSDLKDEFKDLQLDVQGALFADLGSGVTRLSQTVFPALSGALQRTAGSLNDMAVGAIAAADELGTNGTLDKALQGTTKGLENLVDIPGQAVTAFGQLAAAAAPAFDRITQAVAGVADKVALSLAGAFESGALEDAINGAVDSIEQLGTVAKNVFKGIGNILSAVTVDGEGLFDVLETLSATFARVTGSKIFQQALGELSSTMAELAKTAAPLFVSALEILASIFVELGPPARELIRVLGPALEKVLEASREPLRVLARVFGELVVALGPFITLAGELIAALLPSLTPMFEHLSTVIQLLTPFVEQLAKNFGVQLLPFLEKLPGILEQILPAFARFGEEILPQLTEILVELSPHLATAAEALANMLVELTPLIVAFIDLQTAIGKELLPIIGKVLAGAILIVATAFRVLADAVSTFVIPVIRTVAALLRGDFKAANEEAGRIMEDLRRRAGEALGALANIATRALAAFVAAVQRKATEAKDAFVRTIVRMGSEVIGEVSSLPGEILGALSGLDNILFSVGANIIAGLINGIRSQIGRLRSIVSEAANVVSGTIADLLSIHSPSLVMTDMGEDTLQGYINGIKNLFPRLRDEIATIATAVPVLMGTGATTALPNISNTLQPVITVRIGNEQLDGFIDTRITQSDQTRSRVASQGVRF